MKKNIYIISLFVYIFFLMILPGCSGDGYIPVSPQQQITPGGMAYM